MTNLTTNHKYYYWLIAACGIFAIVFTNMTIVDNTINTVATNFEFKISEAKETINEEFDDISRVLSELKTYFYASGTFNEDGFNVVLQEAMRRNPHILNGFFAPIVKHSDRAQFEQNLATSKEQEVQITTRNGQRFDKTPKHSQYFPVQALMPKTPFNSRYYGWDLYTDPAIRDAIDKAIAHNTPVRSIVIDTGSHDMWVIQAVYPGSFSAPDTSQVFGIYALKVNLDAILAPIKIETELSINYEVVDSSNIQGHVHTILHSIYQDHHFSKILKFNQFYLDLPLQALFTIDSGRIPWQYHGMVTILMALVTLLLLVVVKVDEQRTRNFIETQRKEKEFMEEQNRLLEDKVKQRTQEVEEQKVKAEKASRAKTDFLSSMSHELKTPLNAIMGYAQLLQYDADQFDEDTQSSISSILKGSTYLLALIKQVMELSSLEKGKLDVNCNYVNITETLKSAADLMIPMSKDKNIALATDFPDEPHQVWADPTRLLQIVLNLITNAIKYNRPNGSVTVIGRPLENCYRVEVKDTGIGMDEESLKTAFQMFTRFATKKVSVEGIGVGLAVVKHLIDRMNGNIGIDSEVDVGSTFWFEIPYQETAQDADQEQTAEAS